MTLSAPFPWFGGKRKVAGVVWRAFGSVENYIEPFFGSGAVLLGRPSPVRGTETVNDLDGLIANFWRAIKHSPEETAEWADNPVNENDLHARHIWLLDKLKELPSRLEADPEWHCPKIAGWWCWGMACWIGGEFCSGKGPWQVVDGKLVHLGDAGQGVNRKLVHLGDAGQGVNRKLVHLGDWFGQLSARLESVRVASGDWSRICGPSVTHTHGVTGVFLDPPYAHVSGRDPTLYRRDSGTVAYDVRAWAIEAGQHSAVRIALCGYDREHEIPASWSVYEWNAGQGYGAQAADRKWNGKRERIWFSPACQPLDRQLSLLDCIS